MSSRMPIRRCRGIGTFRPGCSDLVPGHRSFPSEFQGLRNPLSLSRRRLGVSSPVSEIPLLLLAVDRNLLDRYVVGLNDDRRFLLRKCGRGQTEDRARCLHMENSHWLVSCLFFGTPLVWQSAHFTQWTLCLLSAETNVVSIFSTSRPQFDILGWQVAHEARVFSPCWSWQARQLIPSWTPNPVRSSPLPTCMVAMGA